MTESPIQPTQGFVDEALAVDVYTLQEQGRLVVCIDVIFWDETVHHRIASYATERQAELAARFIKSGAQRNLNHPPFGL
jgi:hypothetical protein